MFSKIIFAFLLFPVAVSAQIVLSEVMFDPVGDENTDEFIEIYNISSRQSVDLRGYRVGDQSAQESLAFPDSISVLAPGQFAVIFDLDYLQRSSAYLDLIPEDAVVLVVDDRTLGSGGLSNSRAETIVLLDAQNDTLAQYTYSLDNSSGYSDEKIDLAGEDNPGNWQNSRRQRGTPGARNSVSPKLHDLSLSLASPSFLPTAPRLGDTVRLRFVIENIGIAASTPAILTIVLADSLRLPEVIVPALAAADEASIEVDWQASLAGTMVIAAFLEWDGDEDFGNNGVEDSFAVGWPDGVLVINEVMYAPVSAEPEWIEVYNASAWAISLIGWRMRDASGKTGHVAEATPAAISPAGFAVLCADTSIREIYAIADTIPVVQLTGFPSLNNATDTIALLDFSGTRIDSMLYAHDPAFAKGASLERFRLDRPSVDPANWLPSTDATGATPGRMNSVSPMDYDVAIDTAGVRWSPEQPQREDHIALTVPIVNAGHQQTRPLALDLYADHDADGIFSQNELLLDEQLGNILRADEHQAVMLTWRPTKSGIVRLRLQLRAELDERPQNNAHVFNLPVGFRSGEVLLNEIMAAPDANGSEWIEIYNPGTDEIDLSQWVVADASAASEAIKTGAKLGPKRFAIVSADSMPLFSEAKVISVAKFPSLSNASDIIRILDFYGRAIDSLAYVFPAEALNGFSLERISSQVPTADRQNWGFCVDPARATPGRENSIHAESSAAASQVDVSPNPFSPDGDGSDDYAIISYQLPFSTSQVNLTIFDLRGRPVRHLLNNAASGAQRRIIWDGRADDGRLLDIGIYLVFVEAIDASGGRLERGQKTVVLAKKL